MGHWPAKSLGEFRHKRDRELEDDASDQIHEALTEDRCMMVTLTDGWLRDEAPRFRKRAESATDNPGSYLRHMRVALALEELTARREADEGAVTVDCYVDTPEFFRDDYQPTGRELVPASDAAGLIPVTVTIRKREVAP